MVKQPAVGIEPDEQAHPVYAGPPIDKDRPPSEQPAFFELQRNDAVPALERGLCFITSAAIWSDHDAAVNSVVGAISGSERMGDDNHA
jgi:hypothetical protein